MKQTRIAFYLFCISTLSFLSTATIVAEKKTDPDIRTSVIFVKEREMPQTCGYTLEGWIKRYVGYNKIVNNQIKSYADLTPDANQLDKTAIRLLSKSIKDSLFKPELEPGNKPSWNGSICYYSEAGNGQIPSPELIVTEGTIPVSTKKIRGASQLLSSILAKANTSLTGGKYDLRKEDVIPDSSKPRSCEEAPPGVLQEDAKDPNQGLNPFDFNFVFDVVLDALCSQAGNPCQCVMTKMYIKPDSTNQYASYTGCTLAGCKDENGTQSAVLNTNQIHRANDDAINSGGVANVFRPGLMLQLFAYVEQILGNAAGIVAKQETENKQGVRIEDASWSFTKEWETSVDFINCKLFPYEFRSKMPECNRNWLANLVQSITYQMQPTPTPTSAPSSSHTP